MVIQKLRYSGAYKMFLWLANMLSMRGHDVVVMTFMPSDEVDLNPNIYWIKRCDLSKKPLLIIIETIRKEIKTFKPDVSISFLLDANVYNIFACLGLKTKSVVCERNDPFKPGYYVLHFLRPWFRFANGAVFQLPKVADFYNIIKAPTAIIPNPVLCYDKIELDKFEKRPDTINVLGRLDIFQKRHDVLIDAFSIFVKNYPSFKLVFYGDGPDKDKMLEHVSHLGLEGCVFFAGITKAPIEVMKTSKMYVLTSDFEGIPNALIEAMSIGLPCISTDCSPGGARLLIENGENGFIVPSGNPEEVAKKMIWYMENTEQADVIGLNARKIRERFSEENIINLWERYLIRIV